jgi:hypothetical protein
MNRQHRFLANLTLIAVLGALSAAVAAEAESEPSGDADKSVGAPPPAERSKYVLTPSQMDAVAGGQVMPYWGYKPPTADQYADALKAGNNMMKFHICNMYNISC